MTAETRHVYLLVSIQTGKEQEFASEVLSKGLIFDSEIERLDFVYGSFDFIVVLTGSVADIDRRILEMRQISYVQNTETLIPFEMLSWDDSLASKYVSDLKKSGSRGSPSLELELPSTCTSPVVLYSTKGGKTKKVALELGAQLNCPCLEINKNSDPASTSLDDFDLVLIGTGIYRAGPNEDMVNFLKAANLDGDKQFGLFLTWYRLAKNDQMVFDKIDQILEAKGKKLVDGYFECLGDYSKGHPSEQDLAAARKWVGRVGNKAVA